MKTLHLFSSLILLFGASHTNAHENCSIWNEFVKGQKANESTLLLDFSFAGYHFGEKAIPDVKATVFNVCDYGAIPNDDKSDRSAVEKAIKAAEANKGGIIFFPKGRYNLHETGDANEPIQVQGANIVFRGEGSGPGGSEIFMKQHKEAAEPNKLWSTPCLLQFSGKKTASVITPITHDAPRGTFQVTVKDAHKLHVGQRVNLSLKNNNEDVIAEELCPYCVESKWTQIIQKGVEVQDFHQIIAIDGNVVTFKEPIMKAVKASAKWKLISYTPIEEVGIEDIAFIGNWKEKFVHHKNAIHDGGWKMISFSYTANSWIRRCTFHDVSVAASIGQSANVSVYECIISGNRGHNAINSSGSSRVFLGAIEDQPAQWHSVGVARPSIGTVLWRIRTNKNSCFESHASQPRATLIDASEGGFMRGRAGGAVGSNPNHLADLVLWNYHETDEGSKDFDFWATDTPFWRFMPPVIVGFHGAGTTFLSSQVAYEESNGTPVNPESLYEEQLKLRLGSLPQWLTDLKKRWQK